MALQMTFPCLQVTAPTVSECPDALELARLGVDGIISDYPNRAIKTLLHRGMNAGCPAPPRRSGRARWAIRLLPRVGNHPRSDRSLVRRL